MADDGKPSAPHDPNAGRTWLEDLPSLIERRRQLAERFVQAREGGVLKDKFAGGIEEQLERGLVTVQPQGDRVLLRSIMPEDAIGVQSGLWKPQDDARAAVMYEVVAVGPGVRRYFEKHGYTDDEKIKPGDFVWALHVVADRMSARDKTCRIWTTRVKYIASKVVFAAPSDT